MSYYKIVKETALTDFKYDEFTEEVFEKQDFNCVEGDEDEIRLFLLNKAPHIVVKIHNDGELVGECTLAEHLYINQLNTFMSGGLMDIGKTGYYNMEEYHSGVWEYEVVKK